MPDRARKILHQRESMESIARFLQWVAEFVVYGLSGLAAAYYFYHYRRKDLPGGFWGASVVAVVGAVLVSMLTGIEYWFTRLISWLMQPRLDDILLVRVNIIAAVLGAFLFVYILNRINQDRGRR